MALFSGVALTASGFVPAHAQQEARPQTNAQFQDRDDDATRRELADLDRFLDQHQQVNQELQANPRLINDQNYLNAHPQFAQFLQTHPALQRRFSADPNQFLLLENRFEGREERGERANPEATRRELAELDRFLDAHPRVGTELQANPGLINSQTYLNAHPEFSQFLQAHPMLQQRFSADPNEFLRLENRFEAREERAERAQPPEAMPRELAELDRFLDSHPRVNQDLQANPGLVNDRNYLNTHPQFAQFLETHPILQQRFSANPNSFIRREGRFDAREDRTGVDRDRDARVPDDRDQPEAANRDDRDRDRNFDPDRNRDDRARNVGRPDDGLNPPVTQRELAQMDQFLDDHPKIEKDLEKNPSQVNNKKFLDHHRELAVFLELHPTLKQQFAANPTLVMRHENRFGRGENQRNLAQMDQFLDKHKKIAKELAQNPSRGTDPNFLDHHKDLANFFDTHQELKTDFAANPTQFMRRESQFETQESSNHRLNRTAKKTNEKNENKNLEHREDLSSDRTH